MKKLFQKKKLLIIAGSAAALVIVAGIVCAVTFNRHVPVTENEPETTASQTSKDVVIEMPDTSDSSDTEKKPEEISDDGSALKPDENISDSAGSKSTGEKAQTNVTAAPEAEPPADSKAEENTGGVQIGGIENNEEYSCGVANHHCKTAENHAYLLNLELEGCPYCGSHSCPSFYAVNEWGYPRCDPTLCPQYSAKKDPIQYCQVCGKKIGNGQNGTCTQYINACDCPFCGEHVESRTCHTCK